MKNQSNKYKKRNKQISNNEWFKKRGSIQQQAGSTHNTQHFEYKLKKNSAWLWQHPSPDKYNGKTQKTNRVQYKKN